MRLAYPCPTCKSSTIIASRRKFTGGNRFERVCVGEGHRFSTFKGAGQPERLTAILQPVEPPVIDWAKIGSRGCNPECLLWGYCTTQKPEFLPCEVYFYEDENPAWLDDSRVTAWPGLRLQVNEGAGL